VEPITIKHFTVTTFLQFYYLFAELMCANNPYNTKLLHGMNRLIKVGTIPLTFIVSFNIILYIKHTSNI